MKNLFLILLFTLTPDFLLADDAGSGHRTRLVCQSILDAKFYPTRWGARIKLDAPRLMVIDQDQPSEKSFFELIENTRKKDIPFTLYANSRIESINITEDMSDADILSISEEIVREEKGRPFDIRRQSGEAKGTAEIIWAGIEIEFDLGDDLKLKHHSTVMSRNFDFSFAIYKGDPPRGYDFTGRDLGYKCYGPFEVPADKSNDEDVYYGDEPPETSTRY